MIYHKWNIGSRLGWLLRHASCFWRPELIPSDFRDGGLGEGDGGYLGVVGGSGYPADDEADHYSVVGYLKYARSCSGVAEKSDSPTQ